MPTLHVRRGCLCKLKAHPVSKAIRTNTPSQTIIRPQQHPVVHRAQGFQLAGAIAATPARKPRLDPGATPRLESALKCLYATLSFSIPINIIQITTVWHPIKSYWLSPITSMFTIIFSSTLIMVTFRDRARLHPSSTKCPPKLPALCRLPTILFCFLIVVLWMCAVAFIVFNMYSDIVDPYD
ncbi:hypothetical protein BKA70DRAFT_1437891 [Coprinopsis sp. MPI-PUGE-AT-0042]|nr:hypothetical protein BKA70DRAFT_1437891 [Coprinopsis sp. MPI-PUGE-AT-0042]